jgi:hypothetical protein
MSCGEAGTGPESSTLPPLYAAWAAAFLSGPIPAETDATCEDCAMCAPSGRRPERGVYFAPDVKCCSYMPTLPNFLVGRMLRDDDPALAVGRKTIEARLAARVAVTPLGLGPTPTHAALYDKKGDRTFGRNRALICPHFVGEGGGRCAIWRHRNGVCATWFCKHVRGGVGLRFWQALEQLLSSVETELARWCVLELGIEAGALHELFRETTDRSAANSRMARARNDTADEGSYGRQWGPWAGQERRFFVECARLVDGLAWPDVVRIGGATTAVFERLTQEAYRRLTSHVIPERLQVGKLTTVARGRSHARIVAYSGLDPIHLPTILVDLLPYFDGGATADTLRRIRRDTGLALEPALVRRLVDYEILVAPDAPERALES